MEPSTSALPTEERLLREGRSPPRAQALAAPEFQVRSGTSRCSSGVSLFLKRLVAPLFLVRSCVRLPSRPGDVKIRLQTVARSTSKSAECQTAKAPDLSWVAGGDRCKCLASGDELAMLPGFWAAIV